MSPITDDDNRVTDWSTPSSMSAKILGDLKKRMEASGYEVLTYDEVVKMEEPHSILIVSSFFSSTMPVENSKAGQPDRYLLTMLRVKTFDVDLNPAKARSLCNLDGVSFVRSDSPVSDLESKSMGVLIDYLGDNITGHVNF